MGYSPFVRAVGFWGNFYVFYHYAQRDPATKQYNYPSYLILKEKVVREQWKNGINGDKLQESMSLYSGELWNEIKSLYK